MIRRALFASIAASILAACGKTEQAAEAEVEPEAPRPSGGKVDAKLAELGIEMTNSEAHDLFVPLHGVFVSL